METSKEMLPLGTFLINELNLNGLKFKLQENPS